MNLPRLDAWNVWLMLLVLCLGTYIICVAYIALFGSKWRGHGNMRREILALSGTEQADYVMS